MYNMYILRQFHIPVANMDDLLMIYPLPSGNLT